MIVRRVPTFFYLVFATLLISWPKVRGRATHVHSLALTESYDNHDNAVIHHENKPLRPKTHSGWNLSRISSVGQLEAWSDRVATASAEKKNGEESERPARVFVSYHGEWMTRTSAPSTLQPDGSFLIDDCNIPCVVEFNKDQEQRLSHPGTLDWTPWATSSSVRAADIVMQVDRPWNTEQLQQLRTLYPQKRAVFASWEPVDGPYRIASIVMERNFDWFASFTFSGRNAADVPCSSRTA